MIEKKKRLLAFSSPSGGGKSTISRHLLKVIPNLRFSISATTRQKRPNETWGVDYFFISHEDFEEKIKNNEFIEYEEIFGNYYGTLKSEIKKAIESGENLVFDIDVKGALSIKKAFPEHSVLIFISPPDGETLRRRLESRGTESEEELTRRLARAEEEMEFKDQFDYVINNEDLQKALQEAEAIARSTLV